MAHLAYALNQSLDGYVDHDKFAPDPVLFRHFVEDVRTLSGSIYGRTMYEIMRYWDDEQPGWSDDERDYARAWRAMPKWVVSRTLKSVGPNATLIEGDAETAIQALKAERDGVMEIAGPKLAGSMTGLIDEYRIYVHPVVLGGGKPYFLAARPKLRFASQETIGNAIRLSYVPV